MALVDADSVEIGDTVEADVRGRRVAAEVVALPFYKRKIIWEHSEGKREKQGKEPEEKNRRKRDKRENKRV